MDMKTPVGDRPSAHDCNSLRDVKSRVNSCLRDMNDTVYPSPRSRVYNEIHTNVIFCYTHFEQLDWKPSILMQNLPQISAFHTISQGNRATCGIRRNPSRPPLAILMPPEKWISCNAGVMAIEGHGVSRSSAVIKCAA